MYYSIRTAAFKVPRAEAVLAFFERDGGCDARAGAVGVSVSIGARAAARWPVCFEPELRLQRGTIACSGKRCKTIMLSLGNSDPAELGKDSCSQEEVKTTAVHLWKETLETGDTILLSF